VSLPKFDHRAPEPDRGSWQQRQGAWADEIRRRLEQSSLRPSGLAEATGVNEATLRNWLLVRTRVDPTAAYRLATWVGADPLQMAELLGYLPPGSSEGGLREQAHLAKIQLLEKQQLTLQALLAEKLSELVRVAASTNEFSLEIRLSSEGQGEYRIHDAVYTAVLRPLTPVDDFADPYSSDFFKEKLAPALSSLGAAVQESRESWPADVQALFAIENRLRVWLIPRLNALHSPSADPILSDPSSIVIVGSHLSTWASDIASILGLMIGYGSANTNLLTRQRFGHEVMLKPERAQLRDIVARQLLREPQGLAHQLVWAHTEGTSLNSVLEFLATNRPSPFLVYLRSTDRLHEYIQHRNTRSLDLEALTTIRSNLDTAVAASRCHTLTLNVGFPTRFDPRAQRVTPELRGQYLLRSMVLAHQIAAELIPATTALHRDCPPVISSLREQFAAQADEFS
jgi:transcriptional regulator with XRE-family HTH domain